MLKIICSYSALAVLSLAILTGTAAANSRGSELIDVEGGSYSLYNRLLNNGSPQLYRLKIRDGRETSVKIHSDEGVSVKLYLPNGEIRSYGEEKNFGLEFRAAGEYLVEVQSSNFSRYTLKASTR